MLRHNCYELAAGEQWIKPHRSAGLDSQCWLYCCIGGQQPACALVMLPKHDEGRPHWHEAQIFCHIHILSNTIMRQTGLVRTSLDTMVTLHTRRLQMPRCFKQLTLQLKQTGRKLW